MVIDDSENIYNFPIHVKYKDKLYVHFTLNK